MQEHIRVAEAMRLLFKEKQKMVMQLTEVVEMLQDRIYGQFMESTEMKRVIASISRILPHWCRIVTVLKGNLVKLDGRDKLQIGQIKIAI